MAMDLKPSTGIPLHACRCCACADLAPVAYPFHFQQLLTNGAPRFWYTRLNNSTTLQKGGSRLIKNQLPPYHTRT
eukprot:5578036-Amphidinium_carterae.1